MPTTYTVQAYTAATVTFRTGGQDLQAALVDAWRNPACVLTNVWEVSGDGRLTLIATQERV